MKIPVKIPVRLGNEVAARFRDLAERRYGDRGQKSMNRVAADVLRWKIASWKQDGMSPGDQFCVWLALWAPLPWLRKWGWGKIITSYFR